jgi:dolichol-phosphate mannosyltransferase
MWAELSIVIPVRDESVALPGLLREIEKVLVGLNQTYEILVIDDHSIDGTPEIVKKLAINKVSIISLDQKRMGKDWALERGLREAGGQITIMLDGDGQNDPKDIPGMLEALKNADMVCGVRNERNDPVLKKVLSAIANKVRIFITEDSLIDAGCALRVMRSRCMEVLYPVIPQLAGSAHYFFPTILKKQGYKVIQVDVNHRKRVTGKSKFRFCKGRVISGLRACFYIRNYIWGAAPYELT